MYQKVNLFIVGAAKSGTTSLWRTFKSHPDVFVTEDELFKEPSYFSSYGENMGIDVYHALYAGSSGQKYICDASTAYLTSPESAERIYQYNPAARIIIILRDPVARAYSLYNWMVADGYEWVGTFERALEMEDKRFKNGIKNILMPQYFWNYMYFRSGCYLNQVERYLDYFKENLLVLSFNELIASPEVFFSRICDFLGIENIPIEIPKENTSVDVYFPALTFMARILTMVYEKYTPRSHIKTKRGRDYLVSLTQKNARPKPINESTKNTLIDRYADELISIERNLGITLVS